MAAAARDIIDHLRGEIRRLERRSPAWATVVSTGHSEIDALLPGRGLARGSITQLSGGEASGKTRLALSTLAALMGERGLAAWVDGRSELYPVATEAEQIDLERLLIIRPFAPGQLASFESIRRGLWAAEALLASGAFEGVVVDLPLERARASSAVALDGMLRRLRGAAERGMTIGLWLCGPGAPRIPSAIRLELSSGTAESTALRRAASLEQQQIMPAGGRGEHHAA